MRNIYFAIVGIFLFLAGGFVAAQQPLPENVLQPPLGKSSIAFSDPNYRDEIRSIVVELSRYTKARNPDFIVMGMGSLDLLVKTRQDAVREKANAPNIPISQTLPLGAPWPTYLHSFDGVILDSPFCFYPTENDIRAAIGPISRDLSDDQKAAELERGTRQALLNEIDRQLGFATLLRNEGGSIFAINRCNSLQSAVHTASKALLWLWESGAMHAELRVAELLTLRRNGLLQFLQTILCLATEDFRR